MANLILINQFGEESNNYVQGGDANLATPIAAGTVLSNLTGGSASPIGNTVAALTTALPTAGITAKLLTGLPVGAATTILASDSILAALAKLQAQIDAL